MVALRGGVQAQTMLSAAGRRRANQGSADVVTLSGELTQDFQTDPADSYAYFKVDQNGNLYEYTGSSPTPSYQIVDSATDWVRPTSSAPGLYEVRVTGRTGDTFSSQTAADDTWHSLSSGDFVLHNERTIIGNRSTSYTLEIRYNGGSVLASGSYTLLAEVDSGL